MISETKQNIVQLEAEQAYRVQRPIDRISLTLLEGTAEIFGKELIPKYENIFDDFQPFSIFTWTSAKIKIFYLKPENTQDPGYIFNEDEYPYNRMMYQIAKINHVLQEFRMQSQTETQQLGPRVLIIGNETSGKSQFQKLIVFLATLCKTLLNYGFINGWKTIHVDLNVDQQTISQPGTLSAEVYKAVNSQSQQPIRISFYLGHKCKTILSESKKGNHIIELYKQLIKNLGQLVLKKLIMDMQQQQDKQQQYFSQMGHQIQPKKLANQHDINQLSSKDTEDEVLKLLWKQKQTDADEKHIFASGCIIDCPTIKGKTITFINQKKGSFENQQNIFKAIIASYNVNIIIVIDLPDTYRELENFMNTSEIKNQMILLKLEKLRGVCQSSDMNEPEKLFVQYFKQNSYGESVKSKDIKLFELKEQKDTDQLRFQKVERQFVWKVIGILHLKISMISTIEEDQKISNDQKEELISQRIKSAPLAFIAYVQMFDSEKDQFSVLIPDEQYSKILHENVWIIGALTCTL